jgi:gliding motility-associated-like protein
VNLNITGAIITPPITANACSSYTAPWGTVYTQSGTYSDTLTTAAGCDSIVSVNLNITGAIITPPITANACSSYTAPWGTVYTQSGTYSDTLTTAAGCDSIVSVNLNITGLPALSATTTADSCAEGVGTAVVNVSGGTAPYTYVWSNGATGSQQANLNGGFYNVTVTDQKGCTSTALVSVPIVSPPVVNVNLSAISLFQGDSVQLIASGAVTYQWTPATGLSCSACPNPVASPLQNTVYTAIGIDANGCRAEETVSIIIDIRCNELFVPTIFSPNSSGPAANEQVCVFSNCIAEMDFAIYDRWGQLVFETKNPKECWDGTKDGKEVGTGAYTYRLLVKQVNGIEIKKSGSITLTR